MSGGEKLVERISITTEITKDDLIQFNVDTISQLKLNKVLFISMRILSMILFIFTISAIIYKTYNNDDKLINSLSTPILSLFIISLLIFILSFMNRTLSRIITMIIFNKGSLKTYLGKNKYTFNDDSFVRENDSRYERINWDIMEKYVIVKNHMYLYDSIASAYIIPKRNIDKDTLDKILSFLGKKVKRQIKLNEQNVK